DGKHGNHFRDELVSAMAEMINTRWRPYPPPGYVVCVPSRNHPDLVPDFARRLARALGLPFADIIVKVRDNEPQKRQENSFHQCRNLDGVFGIGRVIPGQPVLLVDDIVDSGWTMTVLAALLRAAGSGPVYPVALATTNPGE
ncbi:MAG TPA: phosphoribosyltransferase, partial [Lamprocystis sp. (in: g-proteobacteria)]|nr:phosphoribosyltransferase [Lamprocystis sp. (in: g-proteobacteria)]